jgi:Fe2+ or Zn2+ uptake regulation protein
MSTHSSLVEQLRARGVRITPQRVAIAQAIDNMQGHFTAEDVCSAVQCIRPEVNTATVYRTLELLVSADLATESHLGGGCMHFALRNHADHHHAVCRGCGSSVEFDARMLDSFLQEMRARHGFALEAHHMVVFGWCARCRSLPMGNRLRPGYLRARHASD